MGAQKPTTPALRTLSGKARLAGVIGWPVGHSLSPRLHGYWLQSYEIDGAYVPLPIQADDLHTCVRVLPRIGFAGVNVTVPHKEAALKAADAVDAWAKHVGAANTLVFDAGRIEARNTDAFGFIENIRATVERWSAKTGPAVVLGAGGSARAVVAALIEAGAPDVRLVNRTPDRAKAVAAHIGGPIRVVAWEERSEALAGAALLVNTTVLGMSGRPPLDLALDRLPQNAVVNDIVYVPLQTPLLKSAAARGNTVVDGIGMLLHQARPGFAAWFGVEPEVTPELRAYVLAAMNR